MGKTSQQILLGKLYELQSNAENTWIEYKLEEIIKEIEKSIIEDKTIGI